MSQKTFADYKGAAPNWITLASGEYYPDILESAQELYKPVLVLFGQLLRASESSARLLLLISEIPDGWMRIQLLRVFRKYVSPDLPVEMLKKKRKVQQITEQFGKGFRRINKCKRLLPVVRCLTRHCAQSCGNTTIAGKRVLTYEWLKS